METIKYIACFNFCNGSLESANIVNIFGRVVWHNLDRKTGKAVLTQLLFHHGLYLLRLTGTFQYQIFGGSAVAGMITP